MSDKLNPVRALLDDLRGQGFDPNHRSESKFILQNDVVEAVVAMLDAGRLAVKVDCPLCKGIGGYRCHLCNRAGTILEPIK